MVELREAELLAHHMESCLRAVRQRRVALTPANFEVLVDGARTLEARRRGASRRQSRCPSIDVLLEQLRRARDAGGGRAEPRSPSHPRRRCAGRRPRAGAALESDVRAVAGARGPRRQGRHACARRLLRDRPGRERRAEGRSPAAACRSSSRWRPATKRAGAPGATTASPTSRCTGSAAPGRRAIRAELRCRCASAARGTSPQRRRRTSCAWIWRRLDELMRLVGDMVVTRRAWTTRCSASRRTCRSRSGARCRSTAPGIERQLRDLREGVMRVRLVPVGEIFRRMPFVVRDLARDSGKRVRLELAGQAHGDRQVPDRADDGPGHPSRAQRDQPRHRDAASERVAAGKPPEGDDPPRRVDVGRDRSCSRSATTAPASTCAAVAARARAAGMAVPDGPLDARALLDIICASGFSTRDEADRASGRGVGMAVVRSTVRGARRRAGGRDARPAAARRSRSRCR